jgi:hypothetical protein
MSILGENNTPKRHKQRYLILLIISTLILASIIIMPFIGTYMHRSSFYENWSGDIYVSIPFIILIIIIWLAPLAGGIITIISSFGWFVFWSMLETEPQRGINIYLLLEGIIILIAGILSIAFHLVNKNRTSNAS